MFFSIASSSSVRRTLCTMFDIVKCTVMHTFIQHDTFAACNIHNLLINFIIKQTVLTKNSTISKQIDHAQIISKSDPRAMVFN